MEGIYQLGGRIIRIRSVYPEVHYLCEKYSAGSAPEISVETSQEDIDYERQKSEHANGVEGNTGQLPADAVLETLAVYRKIAEQMPLYDTVLFHGSAIAVDGVAYLFTAKSGTGKSTHTRLWREMLGDRAVMVNDDKPLIRFSGGEAMVYGTPWNGKHRLSSNICVPLKAVCILERGRENVIEEIDFRKAYSMLLQQTYRPADAGAMVKTLELIDRFDGAVKLYRLKCNMDPQAAETSYLAMK